jgi:hypothetical protein
MNIKANLKDINLICRSCKKPFILTIDEQEFLIRRKLAPFTHCRPCRKLRKKEMRKIMKKELIDNKKNFLARLHAIEMVNLEIVEAPETENISHKEDVSMGLVSA